MRTGVFADVHGNLPAIEAVLADGRRQGVDRWLCLGDTAFRGPAPEECIRLVRSLGDNVALMGNTEEWLPVGPPDGEAPDAERQAAIDRWWRWTIERLDADDLAWVEDLPMVREIECGKERLLCVHATARGIEDRLLPTAPDDEFAFALHTGDHTIVACAHIHIPYLRRVRGTTVLNTGSVGRPIDGDPRASYLILDLGSEDAAVQLRRITYDIDRTAQLAVERSFPWATEYVAALRQGANF